MKLNIGIFNGVTFIKGRKAVQVCVMENAVIKGKIKLFVNNFICSNINKQHKSMQVKSKVIRQ